MRIAYLATGGCHDVIEQADKLKTNAFENVLPFCADHLRAQRDVCLITLINIEGASPRPLGSQNAIANNGQYVGMITGGCAEEALIKHAMQQFDIEPPQRQTVLRLGSDSPWVDIRLPCGAGIDVHFSFPQSTEVFDQALSCLNSREPCSIELNTASGQWSVGAPHATTSLRSDGVFVRHFHPSARIVIVGEGPYVDALASLAAVTDFEIIRSGTSTPAPEMLDAYSAVVLLMHDHEHEPAILETVLLSDCFYVGALGSRTTHKRRVEQLEALGVPAENIALIHGPIGLPIGARSPNEIALSILAEITLKKHQRFSNA